MEDSCTKEVPSSNIQVDLWEQPSDMNQHDGDYLEDCSEAEKSFSTVPPSISNLHLRIDSLYVCWIHLPFA